MHFFQRRLLLGVLSIVAHPGRTLVIAGALLAVCVGFAWTRLNVSSDQNKLFSSDVKFFRDFLEFDEKFPENDAVYVVVQTGDPRIKPPAERWAAAADAIAERLRRIPEYVVTVDAKVPLDKLGAQALLFEEPEALRRDLEDVKRFGDLARLWGEAPGLLTGFLGTTPTERFLTALGGVGGISPTPDAETAHFVNLLAEGWNRTLDHPNETPRVGDQIPDLPKAEAVDPSQLGYYYVPDDSDRSRNLLLVRVYPRVDYTSLTAISEQVEAIRNAVRGAAADFPEFNVGVTGRPALDADEMRTTDRDSNKAEAVAMLAVFLGLVLMLRSVWLALAAEIALAVGIGWTFGWATISVGELNLLSIVFLIALIGIGMDYLVQILTRYRTEARRHARPKAVWARVFRNVSAPINTACLGAAGAFFVSVFTDFRGAADLGIIAGGGLLLCLIAGYTVLPAMLTLLPPKVGPVDVNRRPGHTPPPRTTRWNLVPPLVWVVLLILGIPFMVRTGFNPSLLDLQAPNLESVKLVRKLQTWSGVVLSKDLNVLRQVRGAVEKAPTVDKTDSLLSAEDNYQWLHGHADEVPRIDWAAPAPLAVADLPRISDKAQRLAKRWETAAATAADPARHDLAKAAATLTRFVERLNRAAAAPEIAPRAASRLSEWQVGFVDQLRQILAQFTPQPLNLEAVPSEVRNHFISADGTYALYIYPKEDLWKRENLTQFVKQIESRVKDVPGSPSVTGIASNIYHSTASIKKSFYKATTYALILIVVLVLIDLRNIGQTLLAISVLALGLPMLVALMGLIGVQWNFANFFGLPILIGAGHEYGVFLVHRYREVLRDPRRVWKRWDVSDRALLLCAFVTSSSFGFFWFLGHHEGLKSLGLVMALGTACIYISAVMVVRPVLVWWLDRKNVYAEFVITEDSRERVSAFPV